MPVQTPTAIASAESSAPALLQNATIHSNNVAGKATIVIPCLYLNVAYIESIIKMKLVEVPASGKEAQRKEYLVIRK